MAKVVPKRRYDVFISYQHEYAEWVVKLARKLEGEALSVWLDKWRIPAGQQWQKEMVKGIEEAGAVAVCIGKETPDGWADQEIQLALARRAEDLTFPVIPILLPESDPQNIPALAKQGTLVDFRDDGAYDESLYYLICGIRRQGPGPYQPDAAEKGNGDPKGDPYDVALAKIKSLADQDLITLAVAEQKQAELVDQITERLLSGRA